MSRRFAWLALALALATAAQAQPNAQSARREAAAQKQLQQVRQQIQSLADEQKKIEAAKDAAARELRSMDGEVAKAQRELAETEARIAEQQAQLASLRSRQQDLSDDLTRQRAELAQLLRSAYALDRNEPLQLLLEQNRMSELARVLAYHRYFQQDRQQRIGRLQQQLRDLAALGEQVAAGQAALEQERAQQRQALDRLSAQKRQRGKLVSSLDARYRDRGARLAALGRDEKNTVALLERLRKLMAQLPPSSAGGKPSRPPSPADARVPLGPLRLPLAGTVLAGYGGTMPDGHKSQGLLIAGSPGAQVHAVAAGRVAYADWLKGYGLLLILDHGNGWMTLYAFNDTLLKRAGDSVAVGEAVATVGSSGGQGRPALYFELRRNGQPQDPRSWLKP